jgi:membrane protein required for colicin V production
MGQLDYVILAILGASALYGLLRGMVREVLSLAAWLAGYLVAARVYGYGTEYLLRVVQDPPLAGGISFAAVFIVTAFVLGTLVGLLYRVLKRSPPSPLSRLLGPIFSLARGTLLISVLLLFSPFFSGQAARGDLLRGSPLAPFLDIVTEALSLTFPTLNYGPLDNRLTRELGGVRANRGEGPLWDLARAIERLQPPERLRGKGLSPREKE